jgi:alpha-methylacyl-CoA racemase
VAFGAIEERFFRNALGVLGLLDDPALAGGHKDRSRWPELREALTTVFATRTRDEWSALFEDVEACVSPVLDLDEARSHAHAQSRAAYAELPGTPYPQPAVAPRFSRSQTPVPGPAPAPGQHTRELLAELGYDESRIAELLATGAVR